MPFRDTMAAVGDPALPGLEAAMQRRGHLPSLADGTRLAIANHWEPSMACQSQVESAEVNTPQELAVLVSFFGDWLVTSPLVNFENPSGARVLILAGDRDPVISKEHLDELVAAAGPNVTSIILPGQEHGGVRTLQEVELLRNYLLRDD